MFAVVWISQRALMFLCKCCLCSASCLAVCAVLGSTFIWVCRWLHGQVRGLVENFLSLEWVQVLWTHISGKDGVRVMVMVAVGGMWCLLIVFSGVASASVLQCTIQWIHFARTGATVMDVSWVCCVEACMSKMASTVSLAPKFQDRHVHKMWLVRRRSSRWNFVLEVEFSFYCTVTQIWIFVRL